MSYTIVRLLLIGTHQKHRNKTVPAGPIFAEFLTLLVGHQEWHPACKKEWWGAGVVICLERGADLHIAQLMPLPLTVSCFSEIQIGFTLLVLAHLGSPGKIVVTWVCVRMDVARSSYGIAIHYMLLVLWMTSCLHVDGRHILKVTQQRQHRFAIAANIQADPPGGSTRPGAESVICDCFLAWSVCLYVCVLDTLMTC